MFLYEDKKVVYVIKNCRIVRGEILDLDIGIEGGTIKKIGKNLDGERLLDAKGMLVLPGGIDVHVHFREPGFTHKEDWLSGSRSAVAGGITSVVDQPNTDPPTTTLSALKGKVEIAEKKSLVDFGISAGVTNENIPLIEGLAEEAVSFGEIFLGKERDAISYKNLESAIKAIKKTSLLPTVHAEDEECIEKNKIAYKVRSTHSHAIARPEECEKKAVLKVIEIAKRENYRVHICHVSTRAAMERIMENKNITCEVAPHHLIFSSKDDEWLRSRVKVNPPIRDSRDKNFLWEMLRQGEIDILASDHAPHQIWEKEGDIKDVKPGFPGVETMIPLMLNFVMEKRLNLERILDLVCHNPSKIWGFKRKGFLEEGFDADLTFFDLKGRKKIRAEDLHSRCNWTPYEGFYGIFPKITMIRGKVVFENDEFYVEGGYGRNLKDEIKDER
ncbi:MAG: dihydroorotase [Candidatus Methanolliviera sp. GoM_oil]|nr:MAG: dihydroorotase [Candidatus Methanolliviera sp. GoM_oil]